MIYTAEMSGLSIVIALIWFIASTLLNDKKKKSSNKVDAIKVDKKTSSLFDLQGIRNFLEKQIEEPVLKNQKTIHHTSKLNIFQHKPSKNHNLLFIKMIL